MPLTMLKYYKEILLHPMPSTKPATLVEMAHVAWENQTIVVPVHNRNGKLMAFNLAAASASTASSAAIDDDQLTDNILFVSAEAPIDHASLATPTVGDQLIVVAEDDVYLGWTTANKCLLYILSSNPPQITDLISIKQHILLNKAETVYTAHKQLFDEKSQVVVVLDDNDNAVGILTDKDISQCIERGCDIWNKPLGKEAKPVIVVEETSLIEAGFSANSPLHRGIGIITLDDDGQVVGTIPADKLKTYQTRRHSEDFQIKKDSAALPDENIILDTVLNSSLRTGIVGTDEYLNIIYFNESITDFVEEPDQLRLGGEIWPVTKSCGISRQSFSAYLENARNNREQTIVNMVKINNTQRYIQCRLTTVDSQKHTAGFVLSVQDVTAQRNAEDAIRRLAYHDKLTQLPNRLLFEERLGVEAKRAHRNNTKFAIMMLDLDGFKQVNDAHGHTAGDELLCIVGRRLQSSVRESDTVARFGGDEFVFILPDISHSGDAAQLAQKMRNVIKQQCIISDHEIEIDASTGVSVYPDDSTNLEELLDLADARMYKNKRKEV